MDHNKKSEIRKRFYNFVAEISEDPCALSFDLDKAHKMKTIEYSKLGRPIADDLAKREATNFLHSPGDDRIHVSTENFVLAVRVLIKRGFPHQNVRFLFEGIYYSVNADGRWLQDIPVGDAYMDLLSELL